MSFFIPQVVSAKYLNSLCLLFFSYPGPVLIIRRMRDEIITTE